MRYVKGLVTKLVHIRGQFRHQRILNCLWMMAWLMMSFNRNSVPEIWLSNYLMSTAKIFSAFPHLYVLGDGPSNDEINLHASHRNPKKKREKERNTFQFVFIVYNSRTILSDTQKFNGRRVTSSLTGKTPAIVIIFHDSSSTIS